MIENSLTKPKSAYNWVIVKAARLGVYKMPNYWAQEGVLVITCVILWGIAVIGILQWYSPIPNGLVDVIN